MKLYYFSETSPADAAGDAIVLPQSSFLDMRLTDATKIALQFIKTDGAADNPHIQVTHPAGKGVETMRVLAAALAGNTKSNVIDFSELGNHPPASGILGETTNLITEISIAE